MFPGTVLVSVQSFVRCARHRYVLDKMKTYVTFLVSLNAAATPAKA